MEIKTNRLLLRPFAETDAADLYEYARDPRVGPPAGWPPHGSVGESLEVIRTVFAAPHTFAVVDKPSGRVIGSAGFTGKARPEFPAPNDELGYALSADFWGRGLMPEAVEALLRYAFSELGLAAVPVRAQELVLIVPPGHPLAGRAGVSLAEAAPYPMVCFSRDSGLRAVVDELFDALGVRPQVAWETEEDQVVAGLVAQGFGIAVVPEMDVLHQLDLVALPITAPPYRRDFFLVHDDRLFLSPAAREFRKFVLSGEDGCPGGPL